MELTETVKIAIITKSKCTLKFNWKLLFYTITKQTIYRKLCRKEMMWQNFRSGNTYTLYIVYLLWWESMEEIK